ncbi:hypothetical protein OEA41_000398 [Lepraria neglecta]|uniref:Uncharacterized protein n=1 Tax=Lepraria neglecta TaxID=209136 RepID=A0AAD9ZFW4_9LECA|nr:hypothetical protein OEA41_000398 [Lepraria neglecta]
MVHDIKENPVMEKMGKMLVGELIHKFRLDKQGEFNAHGVVWVNLQVQYRDATLYTIYIQKNPYLKGLITDRSIHNENIKSAHRGCPYITLYYIIENPQAAKRIRLAPAEINLEEINLTV